MVNWFNLDLKEILCLNVFLFLKKVSDPSFLSPWCIVVHPGKAQWNLNPSALSMSICFPSILSKTLKISDNPKISKVIKPRCYISNSIPMKILNDQWVRSSPLKSFFRFMFQSPTPFQDFEQRAILVHRNCSNWGFCIHDSQPIHEQCWRHGIW